MTKADLVNAVADAAEVSLGDADQLVSQILGAMIEGLGRGERIEVRGFGSFRPRRRGGYCGRNPRSGAPVEVPPKTTVIFKPGKELRARMDELGGDAAHDAPR
jgi:integration host factor subunit beta